MTEVKQALIAAGGFGRRMGENLNPLHCKSLMEYAGQSMVGWLIDGLQAGGIEDFVFATNHHSDPAVKEILETKQIPNTVTLIAPDGFRSIVSQVQPLLQDRFLLACGHHPVSATHVGRMISAANAHDNVISSYQNSVYTNDKQDRIVVGDPNTNAPSFEYRDTRVDAVLADHSYVRNPYIVSRDLADQTAADNFRYTFSYYLYQNWLTGRSLGVVEADMPPEFDYPEEYEKTKLYLGDLACGTDLVTLATNPTPNLRVG